MSLTLIKPPPRYDQVYQISNNQTLEQEDLRNRKIGTDIEMGPKERLIVRSPSGKRWSITVSDTGVIGATAAP